LHACLEEQCNPPATHPLNLDRRLKVLDLASADQKPWIANARSSWACGFQADQSHTFWMQEALELVGYEQIRIHTLWMQEGQKTWGIQTDP
jgi:hypothetical protein